MPIPTSYTAPSVAAGQPGILTDLDKAFKALEYMFPYVYNLYDSTTGKIKAANLPTTLTLGFPRVNVDFFPRGANNDDTLALQSAANLAITNKLPLEYSRPLNVSSTIVLRPVSGSSEFYMPFTGNSQAITWTGPSGTPAATQKVFDIAGWRGSDVQGVVVNMPRGVHDVVCWELDTVTGTGGQPNIDTTGSIRFLLCNTGLGTGVNNKGWRLGHNSGGGGDLSNIVWDTCYIFGNGDYVNGVPPTAAMMQQYGQKGIEIAGRNCLTNRMNYCTFGYLSVGITTKAGSIGATDSEYGNQAGGNGNADVTSDGCVYSHCYEDNFSAASQPFRLINTRHEDGRVVMRVPDAADSPSLTFSALQVDNYTGDSNGVLFYTGRPATSLFLNCTVTPNKGALLGANFIRANSYSTSPTDTPTRRGSVTVIGGAYAVASPFLTVEGDELGLPRLSVTLINVVQLGADGLSTGLMLNRVDGSDLLPNGAQRTGNYTLARADANQVLTFNSTSAATLTIPANLFPVGYVQEVSNENTGAVTVVGAGGVTLRTASGAGLKLAGAWTSLSLRQRAMNDWVVTGGTQ